MTIEIANRNAIFGKRQYFLATATLDKGVEIRSFLILIAFFCFCKAVFFHLFHDTAWYEEIFRDPLYSLLFFGDLILKLFFVDLIQMIMSFMLCTFFLRNFLNLLLFFYFTAVVFPLTFYNSYTIEASRPPWGPRLTGSKTLL